VNALVRRRHTYGIQVAEAVCGHPPWHEACLMISQVALQIGHGKVVAPSDSLQPRAIRLRSMSQDSFSSVSERDVVPRQN
jgi:hypothetical protein